MPRVSKLPPRLQPMLAVLTDAPFDDADWVFESKWDGFRMVTSMNFERSRSAAGVSSISSATVSTVGGLPGASGPSSVRRK